MPPMTFRRQVGWLRWKGLACILAILTALVPEVTGQQKRYRPPADYVQLTKPNQEEGRAFLAAFRQKGFRGYLEFKLRVMPRRGPERLLAGKLWNDLFDDGPVSRIELLGDPSLDQSSSSTLRLLLKGGIKSAVWRWEAGTPKDAIALGVDALFEPLGETDLTAFDLQMPFLWWEDLVFEGLRKVRGRPANSYLFYPPSDFTSRHSALAGVRVFLDTQFNALVQVDQIGEEGRLLKTMSVLDLKKVGAHWIVKSIDLKDETTRNKTRFVVTGVAMDQDFSPILFSPEALLHPIQRPERGFVAVEN
ncbi:MAG TPA: outer membrane lipoprotein-sorting protein [Opitutaceae bacterium]|nr:outer membrane lipoprotein-sorting protein [Opitutaceae bacterium]